jgi:hypothetical protein
MKAFRLILLFAALNSSLPAAENLESVKASFAVQQEKIAAVHKIDLSRLGEQLIAAMEKGREAAKKAGDLDGIRAFDAEIERWKKEGTPPLTAAGNPEIGKLHDLYRSSAAELLLKKHRAIAVWYAGYEKNLGELEKSLVAADEIKKAEEVRAERDMIRGSLTVRDALAAVKSADESNTGSPKGSNERPWKRLKALKPAKAEGSGSFLHQLEGRTEAVKVKGETYAKEDFLYTHAAGRLDYEFDEPVSEFRAAVCILDESSRGSVVFSIRSPEGKIFTSKTVNAENRREEVKITFRPTRKLTLIMDDLGDADQDWSFWVKPEYR